MAFIKRGSAKAISNAHCEEEDHVVSIAQFFTNSSTLSFYLLNGISLILDNRGQNRAIRSMPDERGA